MIGSYILVCLFAVANCKTFFENQHLPLQRYQPPLRYQYQSPYQPAYVPVYTQPGKNGYLNEPQPAADINDRQYQQWQIAIPNQQNGGIVWISAPQYGYPPQGAPGYPPSPPSQPPQSPNNNNPAPGPSPTDPSNENTIVRDTMVPSGNTEPPTETPKPTIASSTEYTPTSTHPSPDGVYSSTNNPDATNPTPDSTSIITVSSESTHPTPDSISTSSTSAPPTSSQSPTPENGTVTIEPITPPYNESSTQPTNSSSNPLLKYCKKPRGQFAYPPDCRKFINCWDGEAFEQSCPSGLAFNAEKEYCDYPENVNCTGSPPNNSTGNSNSTSPNQPPSNGTQPGGPISNPKCPSSFGTYRNSSNCAAFYVCVYGEPVDFNCPPGTVYNDDLKVCDYPYRVDCKGSPTIPTPEEPEETESPEPNNSTSPIPPSSSSSSPSSSTNSPSSSSSYPPSSSTSPASSSTSPASSSTNPPTSSSYSPSSSTNPPTSSSYPPSSSTNPSTQSSTQSSTTTTTSTTRAPPIVNPELEQPGVDPVGIYNFNLKKLPESIVNTGVRCYHENIFRLTPDCSSVTVCQDGQTYIVNCGQATSFDAYSQRCVPSFRARC